MEDSVQHCVLCPAGFTRHSGRIRSKPNFHVTLFIIHSGLQDDKHTEANTSNLARKIWKGCLEANFDARTIQNLRSFDIMRCTVKNIFVFVGEERRIRTGVSGIISRNILVEKRPYLS